MDNLAAFETFCLDIGCICQRDQPMKEHTSIKIGGPADLFVKIKTPEAAVQVIKSARELEVHTTVIGKGSNLLVSDEGIRGAVLCMCEETAKPVLADNTVILCSAGASLSGLCMFAQQNSLTGLEFAWGIPASVGGAVYMNAGAYGGEIKDVLAAVEYVDSEGNLKTADAGDLEFGYRRSWFMSHPGCIITSVVFALKKGDSYLIREKMDEYIKARADKQPLDFPSAGSTFKRPPGAYAGQLIEQCGLKGHQIGGAMVSKKHAGFIINVDNATCEDMKRLITEVQNQVRIRTGFQLGCEVQIL